MRDLNDRTQELLAALREAGYCTDCWVDLNEEPHDEKCPCGGRGGLMEPTRDDLRDVTIVRLVEAVTLLLSEHPQWDAMREALYMAAERSGHLRAGVEDG